VVVQIGEEFGSVRISIDGPEDAFDGADLGELAHIAAKGVVSFLTGEDDDDAEDDDAEILAIPLLDLDDEDGDDDDDFSVN
jgi:hypothetical protein